MIEIESNQVSDSESECESENEDSILPRKRNKKLESEIEYASKLRNYQNRQVELERGVIQSFVEPSFDEQSKSEDKKESSIDLNWNF